MNLLLTCKKCSKTFTNRQTYERHSQRKTPCYKELKCKKCCKTFNLLGNYKKHMNRKNSCIKDIMNINQDMENLKTELKIVTLERDNLQLRLNERDQEVVFLKELCQKNNIHIGDNNTNTNINVQLVLPENVSLKLKDWNPTVLKEFTESITKHIKGSLKGYITNTTELESDYSDSEEYSSDEEIETDSKQLDYDWEETTPSDKKMLTLLRLMMNHIWNNKDYPQNKVIKCINEAFKKYNGEIFEDITTKECLDYIMECIYMSCKDNKIKQKNMNEVLKGLLKQCKLHPKHKQFKSIYRRLMMAEQIKEELSSWKCT